MPIYRAGQEKRLPEWSEFSGWGIDTHPPGTLIERHHHDHDEIVIIALGKMLVRTEGGETVLGPGDSVLTRAGEEHEWLALEETVAVHVAPRLQQGKKPGHLAR